MEDGDFSVMAEGLVQDWMDGRMGAKLQSSYNLRYNHIFDLINGRLYDCPSEAIPTSGLVSGSADCEAAVESVINFSDSCPISDGGSG